MEERPVVCDRTYWVAWSRIKGVGPTLLKRLILHFGGVVQAWQAELAELRQVKGIGEQLGETIVAQRQRLSPTKALDELEAETPHFITPADIAYPEQLYSISDPPPVLFYRGHLDLLPQSPEQVAVGIVGTRRPSDYGRHWTRRLCRQLVRRGAIVVSGMASGIDREAHQVALDSQGKTIAVLGTGVDVAYPPMNQDLHQRLCETGLVLSEQPPGTGPHRAYFPSRNRIIAGLSQAVLVTEAPPRSGALITARLAQEQGRSVYALPASLDNPQGQGCLQLIAQGARIILSETTPTEDLMLPAAAQLSLWPAPKDRDIGASPPQEPTPDSLRPNLQRLLAHISREPVGLDALAQQLSLPAGQLLGELMELEILDLVEQRPGMQYVRSHLQG